MNFKFTPPCPDSTCCTSSCGRPVDWNYIWTQPVSCSAYMFSAFEGDIYRYQSESIKTIISQVAPKCEVEMQVYENYPLLTPLQVPMSMSLGKKLYVRANIKSCVDPDFVLYLKGCAARPKFDSSDPSHVLFTTTAGSLDRCASDPTVDFVDESNRAFSTFSFQTFRFCNLPSGVIFLRCNVTLCLPGDVSPECAGRPCHKLQHSTVYTKARKVGRQAEEDEKASGDHGLGEVPFDITSPFDNVRDIDTTRPPYNITKDGGVYMISDGVIIYMGPAPPEAEGDTGANCKSSLFLLITLLGVTLMKKIFLE